MVEVTMVWNVYKLKM